MPTLKDVADLLGLTSELQMASKVGLKRPISTLELIKKYEQLPPKARFTAFPLSGTMPLKVQFTDTSLGYITKREWAFADGGSSTDPNPTHTYRAPEQVYGGSDFHLVECAPWQPSLTVSNKAGSDKASATVTVNPAPPVPNFTATPVSGPASLTVNFRVDPSAGCCLTHNWNFGDNTTAQTSGQSGPTKKYPNPGTYLVVLELQNSAGSTYGSKVITVTGGSGSSGSGSPSGDAPYITAGRDPAYPGNIVVSGSKFKVGASIQILVWKDSDGGLLASVTANADTLGTLKETPVSVPGCADSGAMQYQIDVQATDEAAKTKSNVVKLDCYADSGN